MKNYYLPEIMSKRRAVISAFFILLLLLPGCFTESAPDTQAPSLNAIVVGSGVINRGGTNYPYKLLRLEVDGKEDSYAQWMPANNGADSPAVMQTDPYTRITWNGDPVGSNMRDEEDVFNDAYIYLLNGYSVLNVFGRFYTEGDVSNDLDDMVAGLLFLAKEPGVMRDRIAVTGGSWGGFESLYASAHAPENAVPRVGVALYPVSDFRDMNTYVNDYIPATVTGAFQLQMFNDFFARYKDRINRGTGGDFSTWNRTYLLSKLRTPYLVVHDQWDTLIPFSNSTDLVSQSGGKVRGLWFLKGSAVNLNDPAVGLSHGDLQVRDGSDLQYSMPVYLTLSYAYLIRGIALDSQVIYNAYDPDALSDYVLYLKKYSDEGNNMEWAAAGLLDLADNRVYVVNMDDPENPSSWKNGDAVVAQVLNTVWGITTLNAENVRTYLEDEGLPPYTE